MKAFILNNKKPLLFLIISVVCLSIGSIFFLPYTVNALLQNVPAKWHEYLFSILLSGLGLTGMILFLFQIRSEKTGNGSFFGKILLWGAISLVSILLISLIMGVIAEILYSTIETSFDNIKFAVSAITKILFVFAAPIVLWGFSNIIYNNDFKQVLKHLKSGYLKILMMVIGANVLTVIASIAGNSLLGLILQCLISIVTGVFVIVWAVYCCGEVQKERTE